MKWTRLLVASVCLVILAGCGGGGGGGGDQVTQTSTAKEWLGQHEASIPDQPHGTLILGGD